MAKINTEIQERPEDRRHENLVKFCLDSYKEIGKSAYRKAMIALIQEAREVYEQISQDTEFPWPKASAEVLPFETITIDNLEPRLVAGLIGRDPIVAFKEVGGDLDEIDEILQEWWNDELKDVIKINRIARNVVHTLLLEGTRFSIPKYDVPDKDEIRTDFQYTEDGRIATDENQDPIIIEVSQDGFEGGKDEQIPFSAMFIADDVDTPEKWEKADKIREINYSYSELIQKKDSPGFIGKNIGTWLLPTKVQKRIQEEDKTPSQAVAGVDITGKDSIKCIECHISYPIHNLDEDDMDKLELYEQQKCIVTVAVESKLCIKRMLLRDINMNNQSIIQRIRLFPEEGRSYGTPIHGKMKAIQKGGSDIFNRMINVADIVLLPWYFYESGAGISDDKQKIMPGEGVEVEDIGKIMFPKWNIDIGQYIQLFNVFISLWERLSAMSEPRTGKPSEKQKTATEIMSVIEEGNVRFNYQSETFKEEFLSLIRILYDLYYQWMPYEKTIVHAEKEIPLPRMHMRRPYKFRLTGSTEKANRLIERKENEDIFQMTNQDPLINQKKIREDLLKSYGRDNVEDYISPEINQVIEAFMAAPEQVMAVMQPIMENLQAMEGGEGG